MEKKFTFGGFEYVLCQENGASLTVNGRKVSEWILRNCTERGREFVSKLYVPNRRGAVAYAKEWLAA